MGNNTLKAAFNLAAVSKNVDKYCAEWTFNILSGIEFKPVPTMPKEVVDYFKLSRDVRARLPPDYYRDNPVILAYHKAVDYIKRENATMYDWLLSCRKYLNADQVRCVDDKLKEVTVEQIGG